MQIHPKFSNSPLNVFVFVEILVFFLLKFLYIYKKDYFILGVFSAGSSIRKRSNFFFLPTV